MNLATECAEKAYSDNSVEASLNNYDADLRAEKINRVDANQDEMA